MLLPIGLLPPHHKETLALGLALLHLVMKLLVLCTLCNAPFAKIAVSPLGTNSLPIILPSKLRALHVARGRSLRSGYATAACLGTHVPGMPITGLLHQQLAIAPVEASKEVRFHVLVIETWKPYSMMTFNRSLSEPSSAT